MPNSKNNGKRGKRGYTGPPGPRGIQGETGTNGVDGAAGATGDTGIGGAVGATGDTGAPGASGAPGTALSAADFSFNGQQMNTTNEDSGHVKFSEGGYNFGSDITVDFVTSPTAINLTDGIYQIIIHCYVNTNVILALSLDGNNIDFTKCQLDIPSSDPLPNPSILSSSNIIQVQGNGPLRIRNETGSTVTLPTTVSVSSHINIVKLMNNPVLG